MQAVGAGDERAALRMVEAMPSLSSARLAIGASRQAPKPFFIDAIRHYVYAGDTALHIAAAGYRERVARALIAAGAEVGAKNRRGAEPLHYAVDGGPRAAHWNPAAQAALVTLLVEAGADPNTVDRGGVTPLHRAVRNRCAAAVRALLDAGADPSRKNGSGSTPARLATLTTGRGGSGSPTAKEQQSEILRLLDIATRHSRA
jgi:hypothetical protein